MDGDTAEEAGQGDPVVLLHEAYAADARAPHTLRFQVPDGGAQVTIRLEPVWLVAGPEDGIRSEDAPGCESAWGGPVAVSTGGTDERTCGWLDAGPYEVDLHAVTAQGTAWVIAN